MRRIILFVATNLAVMALLTLVVKIFGIDTYTYSKAGINFQGLLVMSAVLGFGGSFISLLASKWVAKWQTGARVIEYPSNPTESWLLSTVRRQAEGAGIGMPEVAIYDAPEMNAFATGATRNSALVAVSTGLLQQMSQEEVEAVLAEPRGEEMRLLEELHDRPLEQRLLLLIDLLRGGDGVLAGRRERACPALADLVEGVVEVEAVRLALELADEREVGRVAPQPGGAGQGCAIARDSRL